MSLQLSKWQRRAIVLIYLLVTAATVFLANSMPWWLLGDMEQFRFWHENFGLVLWLLKTLMLTTVVISTSILLIVGTVTFIQIIQRKIGLRLNAIWLATLYFIVAAFVGEVHPFTTLPMYKKIRNTATLFYVEDEHGKTIPLAEVSLLPSAFLNKAYSTFLAEHDILFEDIENDEQAFDEIGEYVFSKAIDSTKVLSTDHRVIRMMMLHCEAENNECRKVLLHEKRYR